MDKVTMLLNLLDFKEEMDFHIIPFFFIFGTLLGAKREGDFIECDTDVDVGAFLEDRYKIDMVMEELASKGFDVVPKDQCPPHDNFFIRGNEKIEIWWFENREETRAYDKQIIYPKRFFKPLDTIDFLGEEFNIPSYSDDFLDITYGKDWRIPQNKSYIIGRK